MESYEVIQSEEGILLKVEIVEMSAKPITTDVTVLTMTVNPLDAEFQESYKCPFELIVPDWMFFKYVGAKQAQLILLRRPDCGRQIELFNQNEFAVFDFKNWRVIV